MKRNTCATCLAIAVYLAAAAHLTASEPAPVPNFRPTAQDKIVLAGARFEMLWDEGEFTEGPAPTADGAILFSDIGNRILRYDPKSGKTDVFRAPSGKANGLKFDPQGNLIACEGAAPGGARRISITDRQRNVRTLADRFESRRFNSPNDLAITTAGNIYFTDPRYVGDEPRELDFEGVFLVSAAGAVRVATRDVQKPNGIIVTPDDRTVFLADNNGKSDGNHHLLAFAVKDDGTLSDKRLLFDFGPNHRGIDGMTLDTQGNIYATAGGGTEAGIYVFGPRGEQRAFIATPGDPSNCVFGVGAESTVLYVTGAAPRKPGAVKPAYALYRIRLANPGYHVFPQAK